MIRPLVLAALVGLAGAAAQAQTPPRITNPNWETKPGPDDMAKVYPVLAQHFHVSGLASIACRVTVEGRVSDCEVQSEAPAGHGFAEAALQLAPLFRMRPMTENGEAVADGFITIPIRFRYPDDDEPEAPPSMPAIAPARLALARQVITRQAAQGDLILSSLAEELAGDLRTTPQGARQEARNAFHSAVRLHRAQIDAAAAMMLATKFDDAALSRMAAAPAVDLSTLILAFSLSAAFQADAIDVDARKAYCEALPCQVLTLPP